MRLARGDKKGKAKAVCVKPYKHSPRNHVRDHARRPPPPPPPCPSLVSVSLETSSTSHTHRRTRSCMRQRGTASSVQTPHPRHASRCPPPLVVVHRSGQVSRPKLSLMAEGRLSPH